MLSIMETILFLKRIPLFSNIHGEGLKRIADISIEKVCEAGELIFNEGDIGDVLYIIKKGSVSIFKKLDSGQEKQLAVLKEQQYFGEMAILDDSSRSASARTAEDSILLSVDKDNFREVVKEFPEIAFEIFKVFSQRLREANKEIQTLSQKLTRQPA
ncbi:MAG TPA: cyclic nucleotide-binding domain-containing protein [bacterium]|nr:cyclic nucleotide-binding domain-containing protein [bacterium]